MSAPAAARPPKPSSPKVVSLELPARLPTCRPCAETVHQECEGVKSCGCMFCRGVLDVAREMSRDWDWYEQAKRWRL